MIITLDLGNSDLVIGLFENSELLTVFRLRTDLKKTADEYAANIQDLLVQKGISFNDIQGGIISSVVPQLTEILKEAIRKILSVELLTLAPGIKTGLKIRADNPAEIGADLIADCVGAFTKYQSPILVIDLGTASKIMAVDKNETFIGCIIGPGIRTSKDALVKDASQLPNIEMKKPKNVLGLNTVDCMNSGICYGFAAYVDGLVNRIKKSLNIDFKLVLTGGLSTTILDALENEYIVDKDILLFGLKKIYDLNQRGNKNA